MHATAAGAWWLHCFKHTIRQRVLVITDVRRFVLWLLASALSSAFCPPVIREDLVESTALPVSTALALFCIAPRT